jgi:hypothetical protein
MVAEYCRQVFDCNGARLTTVFGRLRIRSLTQTGASVRVTLDHQQQVGCLKAIKIKLYSAAGIPTSRRSVAAVKESRAVSLCTLFTSYFCCLMLTFPYLKWRGRHSLNVLRSGPTFIQRSVGAVGGGQYIIMPLYHTTQRSFQGSFRW